jgi:RNA ligase (TIGR02306 family)
MRKLATIRKISDIVNIEDSDSLAVVSIDGWKVVVKRGEYQIGDLIIYCEVDSWIPTEIAPFLSKGKEPKEYNGVKGERLKTVRLRGQLSQGLILPVSLLKAEFSLEKDVSEELNIQLYEPPIPAQLSGITKGYFPSYIPKTDEERVQNIDYSKLLGLTYYVTEKLDGSSITIYLKDNEFGVCSRNLDLKEDDNNTFWKTVRTLDIESKLKDHSLNNIALQGELIGEGVQGNRYNIKGHDIRFYNVYDIDKQEYYAFNEFKNLIYTLRLLTVPILDENKVITESQQELISYADNKSILNNKIDREGVVMRTLDKYRVSFKIISNKFLLKD